MRGVFIVLLALLISLLWAAVARAEGNCSGFYQTGGGQAGWLACAPMGPMAEEGEPHSEGTPAMVVRAVAQQRRSIPSSGRAGRERRKRPKRRARHCACATRHPASPRPCARCMRSSNRIILLYGLNAPVIFLARHLLARGAPLSRKLVRRR